MVIFNIKTLANTNILAGAGKGRQVLGLLLTEIKEPAMPEAVYLDFFEVEVATGSFLRESILGFRDAVRSRRSNIYPVIANPQDDVKDEFEEILRSRGDVMMMCSISTDGEVLDVRLIGSDLDPKQRITFDLVSQYAETDASELRRISQQFSDLNEEKVGQTAWNNRLASLSSKGLVMEFTQGRSKRYKPLFFRD